MYRVKQNYRKILHLVLFFITYLLIITFSGCQTRGVITFHQAKLVTAPGSLNGIEKDIASAFEEAISGREDVLSYLLFDVRIDHIVLSADGKTALVWYSLSDPENDELISTESGLAIARLITLDAEDKQKQDAAASAWQITLQADGDWEAELRNIPEELLDSEIKSRYQLKEQDIKKAHKVYDGYRLPWAPGEGKYLTGSIGHVYIYKTCPSTCLYAFDFADGTMWPVLAAKAGRVRYAVWEYPNGNTKHSNYIVLEDNSTQPTTYQVYAHLAQDSIPIELRNPGATVVQGQKIGVVDDTGVSTGHHLHFHVHTNPGSYWGTSVDITFDDVKVNGGRPRTCNESRLFPALGSQCQTGNLYVSGNKDLYEPHGGISSPSDNSTIRQQSLMVDGWGSDDLGIQSLQVMLNYAGDWLLVGEPARQETIQARIDLCELGVPDGSFFIALNIIDTAGKVAPGLPGLKTLTKEFTCPLPPPECEVGSDQVGIFTQPDYQGRCVLLDRGSNITDVFNSQIDTIGSILIGKDSVAKFFLEGRELPIVSSILDTNSLDMKIDQITRISIEERPPAPFPPTITIQTQAKHDLITPSDEIIISWEVMHPSFSYRALLTKEEKLIARMEWSSTNEWKIGQLDAGNYKIFLDIHNIVGDTSTTVNFTVTEQEMPPTANLLPIPEISKSSAIPIRWEITSGSEKVKRIDIRYRENGSSWQNLQGGFPPQTGQFWFFGNPGIGYDFQIRAVDLSDAAEQYHAGQNATTYLEETCIEDAFDLSTNDNTPKNAFVLDLNVPQKHNICDQNDRDWMVFAAEKGSIYRISIDALDTSAAVHLNLYGRNETTPIFTASPDGLGQPTELVWSAPSTGIYYLEAFPFDERLFGTETEYQVEIKKIVQVNSSGILIAVALPILWYLLHITKKITSAVKK